MTPLEKVKALPCWRGPISAVPLGGGIRAQTVTLVSLRPSTAQFGLFFLTEDNGS